MSTFKLKNRDNKIIIAKLRLLKARMEEVDARIGEQLYYFESRTFNTSMPDLIIQHITDGPLGRFGTWTTTDLLKIANFLWEESLKKLKEHEK